MNLFQYTAIAILIGAAAARADPALEEKPARGTAEYAKAHALYAPPPQVPSEARARNLSGKGVFALHIQPDGTVSDVQILQSTGHEALDDASTSAFSKWRFYPGRFKIVKIPITYTGHYRKDGQERNPLLQQAVDASKKGDYDKAIAMCNKAISLNPRDARAYFYRADAYGHRAEANGTTADYDKAIADCNQVIRLDPKSSNAYNKRGIIYRKKGDHNKAVADFTEAIRLNPKFYGAYDNRGNIYSDDDNYDKAFVDYDKALVDYDKAIRLNPRDSTAHNDRGTLYTSKGDYDKALDDLNEALRLDPKNPTIYYNRGYVYAHKGAYDNAIDDDNEAIRLNPRTADEQRARIPAFVNRGLAYYHKGEYEKAIADYNDAIRLDPKHSSAYDGLAWIWATAPRPALRDGRKAVEYATKACELSRWKGWTNIDTLAAACAETGDFAAAIKWEQRSLQTTNLSQEDAAEAKTRLALYQANKPYHEEKPHPPRREEKILTK